MLVLGEIGEDLPSAFQQSGHAPAGGEDAGHHTERDGIGRQAGVDELGGRFSGTEPYTRRQSADDADAVNGLDDGGRTGAGRFAHACWTSFSMRFSLPLAISPPTKVRCLGFNAA